MYSPPKSLFVLFITLFLISLQACKNEDNVNEEPDTKKTTGEAGTVTAKINNETLKSNSFYPASIELSLNDDDTYLITIGAYNTDFGSMIALYLWDTDFSSLKVGDTFTTDSDYFGLGLDYNKNFWGFFSKGNATEDDDTNAIGGYSNTGSSSTCTITKIDRENRLLSGTFSFDATDSDDENITHSITDGVFTELEY